MLLHDFKSSRIIYHYYYHLFSIFFFANAKVEHLLLKMVSIVKRVYALAGESLFSFVLKNDLFACC